MRLPMMIMRLPRIFEPIHHHSFYHPLLHLDLLELQLQDHVFFALPVLFQAPTY